MVRKKVYPHLFRHSRATEDVRVYREAELRMMYGWSASSRMPATYVHLSGRDTLDRETEVQGLKPPEEKEKKSPLEPWLYPFCESRNAPTNIFCGKCGRTTDMVVNKRSMTSLEKRMQCSMRSFEIPG